MKTCGTCKWLGEINKDGVHGCDQPQNSNWGQWRCYVRDDFSCPRYEDRVESPPQWLMDAAGSFYAGRDVCGVKDLVEHLTDAWRTEERRKAQKAER